MSNNFFSRFPLIDYNMDGKGSFLTLTDIAKNVDVNDLYANSSTYYTYHDIVDGERPDTMSYRLYGTPNYYWTFFVLNNDLRAGINHAWPMSGQQLEKMFTREYDPYSAITFIPTNNSVNGIGQSGLMNLVYLWESYLPYLRLSNETGTEWAKILKFDNSLLQLVIYDIEKSNGTPLSSIDMFKNSVYFKIVWYNPFELESDEWIECNELKTEFINQTIDVYAEFDSIAKIDINILPDVATSEEIAIAIANYNDKYVFTKQYIPASLKYRWASYRDAASEYYKTIDDIQYSTSAYDVVLDTNIIEPKYISFYEKEEIINSKKEKIRAIRPDRINEFINEYFDTLNGR